jgi:hypothetical protein
MLISRLRTLYGLEPPSYTSAITIVSPFRPLTSSTLSSPKGLRKEHSKVFGNMSVNTASRTALRNRIVRACYLPQGKETVACSAMAIAWIRNVSAAGLTPIGTSFLRNLPICANGMRLCGTLMIPKTIPCSLPSAPDARYGPISTPTNISLSFETGGWNEPDILGYKSLYLPF